MEWGHLFQAVFALAFVLCLIWLAALGLKRYGERGGLFPRAARRLQLVETLPLDTKRRLVLVRRDDREHMLLIGGATDVIIESTQAPQKTSPLTGSSAS